MHPPSVPTQVGKYHSGSVRGSVSSRGAEREESGAVKGSQAHERGLEQRYKHIKGKKRPMYLKPREEVIGGGRKSGGEWGVETGFAGLDFEAYMKQQQGLERDFQKGYGDRGNSPSPPNSPPTNDSPDRNGSPPKFLPREEAEVSKKMRGRGKGFAHGMTQWDFENYLNQQRGLERDFGKGYGYGGNSLSPPHSPPHSPRKSESPHSTPTSPPIPIPGSVGHENGHAGEIGTGEGTENTSLGDSVRFSDVRWSSVGSGESATGTTGTTGTTDSDPRMYGEGSRGRDIGTTGKHKAAPGQRKLKRKNNFEERALSPATTPASSLSQTVSKEDERNGSRERREKGKQRESSEEVTIEQLEMMRLAIWNGKLEKVVPPNEAVPKPSDILIPPSGTPNTTSSQNSRNSDKSKTSKHSKLSRRNSGKGGYNKMEGRASPIQKLKGYMEHGVEATNEFIEKKTNMKTGAKSPSPFEYLLYPNCGKGERNSSELKKGKSRWKGKGKEEDASDEELWGCVGESNNQSGILIAPHPEEKSQEDKVISNASSTEPRKIRKESNREEAHTTYPENLCKLCRKHVASNPAGLCGICETNFLNTKAWEETPLEFNDDGDIPPTPPPKDHRHITSMREALATTPPNYSSDTYSIDPQYRPPVPEKDDKIIHVSKVENSRPKIINPLPVRQESQKLVYGEMGVGELGDSPRDIEIGFPEWQTRSLEMEGERTEELFKRWSENYRGDDDGEKEAEGNGERDTVFYDFWGDILKSHREDGSGRPETPKLEDRKPKM